MTKQRKYVITLIAFAACTFIAFQLLLRSLSTAEQGLVGSWRCAGSRISPATGWSGTELQSDPRWTARDCRCRGLPQSVLVRFAPQRLHRAHPAGH